MNNRVRNLRRLVALLILSSCCASGGAQSPPAAGDGPAGRDDAAYFKTEIQPLLEQYCITCHSNEKQKGDLDLQPFASLDAVKQNTKVWQNVARQLADNEMPPEDEPQPTPAEKERLTKWVAATLDDVARSRAGDPGPVVLRRLSNAEYTYTVRDLTGVDSLEPAREFPVDGAAGEGFTNTGQALVMSPSLITKYLDAGKGIAGHAVLLPDGIRFSSGTTRRDWSEEILAEIRTFYRSFTDPSGGGEKVNLQGIVFDTNEGGRLPLEKYLAATLEERAAIAGGGKTIEAVARERGLSPQYLGTLWTALSANEPSLLLDGVRARWRGATPADVAAITAEVAGWQQALWKFSSVGHIGKVGGPKAWMEPASPLASKQDVRLKLPAAGDGGEVTLYLVASDAGDGNEHDVAVWHQPRLVAPGRPDLLLRDVRAVSGELARRRELVFASAAKALAAAAEAGAAQGQADVAGLAGRHGVDADALRSWLTYLGIGSGGPVEIKSHLTQKLTSGAGYDFINGWGGGDALQLIANSSDQHVRVPGNMKPHGVAVHPVPTLQVAVGWRSPVAATMRAEARLTHAHPECGNGVLWSLELRRGATRQRLATGVAHGAQEVKAGPIENLAVQPGDLISLLVSPREGNHSCDLTAVDLVLTSGGDTPQTWDLAADVSPDVLAGNPHADRLGNADVWHFYSEPDTGGGDAGPVIPDGSLLARWQSTSDGGERQKLAEQIQQLLLAGAPADKESPDGKLYRQLASFGGPLFAATKLPTQPAAPTPDAPAAAAGSGPDPALFGRHPDGKPADPASLVVRAPAVVEIRLPADLVAGCELVTTGTLDAGSGAEGTVQLQVLTARPEAQPGLLPATARVVQGGGPWTANNRDVAHDTPVLVNDGSAARRRLESAFDDFRRLFPPALCYVKIVPVDEVVTLTLLHREDDHLARLMLDDAQRQKLDRLWDELHYVSEDAFALVDAFGQLMEYATQDADPSVFEPMRKPINDRAAALKQRLVDTQPRHVDGVLAFAARAYRRPLTGSEDGELRALYGTLREQELPHDEAIRLMVARVLVAPAFLYRAETPAPGTAQAPVNDWELANRLSYFLWSSMPDAELSELAAAGRLRDPDTLVAQARRMLGDAKVRRLATEFGCQWLNVHDFASLDEKSERHFPTFGPLRGDMYEESIRFFADLFQRDVSVLSILDADHTFLNESLAKHYGIPDVTGPEWRRVDGVRRFSRGGILALGATLAKQSGASRTSPILRGNWVAEVLLGDRLPRPPKDVPTLPEDEATESLTVRQLTERHSSDPRCAGCHVRIDAFGFALEGFDAIGRRRDRDLGDRPIDTKATVMDGTPIDGIDGLRDYLLTKRRDVFLRQFCRKLLGYALGRGVQLSDEPLLAEMRSSLESDDFRVGAAVETILRSRQFQDIRGRDQARDDEQPQH
jgi:hypothetical protein